VQTHASAAMDVSDGLAGDLAKLCRASSVTAEIDATRLPLSGAARTALAAEPSLIETILAGGDDYEILCTVPARRAAIFLAAAQAARVHATGIGRVTSGEGLPRFTDREGRVLELNQTSFSHF